MVSPAAFFSMTADSPMSAGRQKSTGAQQSSPARVSAGSIPHAAVGEALEGAT